MTVTRIKLERPPLDRDTVERLALSRGEPGWLVEQRLAAAERYARTPWPRNDGREEWRRFPLTDVPYEAIATGRAAPDDLPGAQERGVVNLALGDAVRTHEDLVRTWLPRGGGPEAQAAIRAYAESAWTAGRFVRVPAGADLAKPLQLVTVPGVTRTIVVAERGSRAMVVEDLRGGDGEEVLAIPLLDVHLEPESELAYVQIQDFGPRVTILGSQHYVSARASRLASFNVVVGSARSKIGIGSDLEGDGAVVNLYGLVAGGSDQKIDFNVFQDLSGSHSESTLLYLAALYDHAKAVTYGVIRVEPQSRATSSYQECRNMLLSEHAGADPIPVLEILTNDVLKCGHGATAGAIDAADVFYVQSRGLPYKDAERLIVRGFFERVVEKVRDEDVRRRMLRALAPRIGSIEALEAA